MSRRTRFGIVAALVLGVAAFGSQGCGSDDSGEIVAQFRGDIQTVTVAAVAPARKSLFARLFGVERFRDLVARPAIAQSACPADADNVYACVGTNAVQSGSFNCELVNTDTCAFRTSLRLEHPGDPTLVFFQKDADGDGVFEEGDPQAFFEDELGFQVCNGDIIVFAGVDIDFPDQAFSADSVVKQRDACAGLPTPTPIPTQAPPTATPTP